MQTQQQDVTHQTPAQGPAKKPVIIALPETDLDDIFGAGRCPPKVR